jgi:hypothetical protein
LDDEGALHGRDYVVLQGIDFQHFEEELMESFTCTRYPKIAAEKTPLRMNRPIQLALSQTNKNARSNRYLISKCAS